MTRTLLPNISDLTRSSVGFDRLFNEIEKNFVNSQTTNYPPYNVVQLNDKEWAISVAVAGFSMEELEITVHNNLLTIEGNSAKEKYEEGRYLHRGIGTRTFKRTFTLADHVEVENASLELGILTVNLIRNVPESMQPKKIAISNQTVEN